jgi:hypothetical protein
MVPLFCPETPIPGKNPIYMFSYDSFKRPYPFLPDIAVAVDDILTEKLQMLNCHESQFYEWLPYNQGRLEDVPTTWEERKKWLIAGWMKRDLTQANLANKLLESRYGKKALPIKYAESFELSEYGRRPEQEELSFLLPF